MKLMIMTSRVPWPLEKGDKLRIYHQIKQLSRNHDIYLFSLSDKSIHPEAKQELGKFCERVEIIQLNKLLIGLNLFLGLFSSKPFQIRYFFQRFARKRIYDLIREVKPDHIYCQLIRASEYVKHIHDIPKTLDYMDAFNKGIERRVKNASWILRPIVKEEARRLVAYENLIYEYFEHHCIISDQDRQLIIHPNRENIHVIPNGVDSEFFSPIEASPKYDLVFTGNMNYAPNVNTAVFLVKEVMPLIWKELPETSLRIAGADPSPKVRQLNGGKVSVSGWIRDIRMAYAEAKVFVAPMQIGTGLQNKLLEAMSMKKPCVTSDLANNALGAAPGKEILIGNSAKECAEQIILLLSDKDFANSIASNGHDYVARTFSWEESCNKLEQLISS